MKKKKSDIDHVQEKKTKLAPTTTITNSNVLLVRFVDLLFLFFAFDFFLRNTRSVLSRRDMKKNKEANKKVKRYTNVYFILENVHTLTIVVSF